MKSSKKVIKIFSTRSIKTKFMLDTLKSRKYFTTIRRRLEKASIVKDENIDALDVRQGQDVDPYVVAAIEKRRK